MFRSCPSRLWILHIAGARSRARSRSSLQAWKSCASALKGAWIFTKPCLRPVAAVICWARPAAGGLEARRSWVVLRPCQTVLRPLSGRSWVVLGSLSRREVVRAVQSGRFDPFRLPHIVCQHRELADEDGALTVASFGRLRVQCPSLYLAIWPGTQKRAGVASRPVGL